MDWGANVDSLSSGRGGVPGSDRDNADEQNGASRLKGVVPETILQHAEALAAATPSSFDSRVTIGVDDPTARRVAMAAVGQAPSEEEDDLDFEDLLQGLDQVDFAPSPTEPGPLTELDIDRPATPLLIGSASVGSWPPDDFNGPAVSDTDVSGMIEVLKIFRKQNLVDITVVDIDSKGIVRTRSFERDDLDAKKIALFNQESNVVVHVGFDESQLQVLKQDSKLKGCRFIEISVENLVALRPILLKIINENKANLEKGERERGDVKAGFNISESRLRDSNGEGVKKKAKRDDGNAADGTNLFRGGEANQLKKEVREAEIKNTQQMHLEEAKKNQKEQQSADKKRMIDRKERQRELEKEQIDKEYFN